MNQNQEEKKIKELFVELKRQEERRAPAFEQVWAVAASRVRRDRWRAYFLRVAAAAAALIALAVATVLFLNRQPERPPAKNAASGNAHKSSGLPWQSAVLISEWRAPTDFLLELPSGRPNPPEAQPNKNNN